MNVVHLSIIFSIVILIHYSNTLCPAGDITGCWCRYNDIYCESDYVGDVIPIFSRSNNTYDRVSYN